MSKPLRHPVLVFVVTSAFLHFSCAANPARTLVPTDQEVMIGDDVAATNPTLPDSYNKNAPVVFARGGEALDEQEFYQAIGDTKSYDEVRGSRGAGSFLQGIGLTGLLLGGLATLGGGAVYLLSNPVEEGMPPPTIPLTPDQRMAVFYGSGGTLALAILGGVLLATMSSKVRGDRLVFPLDHARKSLEIARYGADGATPDDIKKLELSAPAEVCAGDSVTLAPLRAFDQRGWKMDVHDRADWFQFLSTPQPGLLSGAPDAPVIGSALNGSFKNIDDDVSVTVKVSQTGVSTGATLKQSLACPQTLSRAGERGDSGSSGSSGRSGQDGGMSRSPGSGGPGGDGGSGKAGGAGSNVVVELAWVRSPKRERLAVAVIGGQGVVFDPAMPLRITARGGSGGAGGSGGSGGNGGSGSMQTCQSGGNGGSGGRGGPGGAGGAGGSLLVRVSDPELLKVISAEAPGGFGGRGGSAGRAGRGGSGASCKGSSSRGSRGADGASGSEGPSGAEGPNGTVRTEVVPLSSLSAVSSFVSANAPLELLGADAAPTPSKKRR